MFIQGVSESSGFQSKNNNLKITFYFIWRYLPEIEETRLVAPVPIHLDQMLD